MNSRGTDEDGGGPSAAIASTGGFFIEDELKIPINRPNAERMPGVLREVIKGKVNKETEIQRGGLGGEVKEKLGRRVSIVLSSEL